MTINWLRENVKGGFKNDISGILFLLRGTNPDHPAISEYEKVMKNNKKIEQKKIEKNDPRENEIFIPWDDLKEFVDDHLSYDPASLSIPDQKRYHKNGLLLALYTYFPPRRALDYSEMYYYKSPLSLDNESPNKNYYYASYKIFVFNNYKTKQTYGRQMFHISDQLNEVILKYIEIAEIDIGDKLLGYNNSNRISQEMSNIDGKGLTPNVFRHSFATWINNENVSLEKRRKYAEKMGHGVMQQLEYGRV